MYKDLIVAIFSPTIAGSDSPKRKASGQIGTGYPVAPDLILTSRHVVEPANRNRRAKLRLCWFFDPDNGSGCAKESCWSSIDRSAVVWRGEGDLDAALIRAAIPEPLRKYPVGRMAETKPRAKADWESCGFARADRRQGVREPGNFGGKARTMADNAAFFEVVESANPDSEKDWCGASGMPVFADGEILDVVKQVPPHYRGKKLHAVPSWHLLRNDAFRQCLGLDDALERVVQAERYLTELLTCSSDVTQALAEVLESPGQEARTVARRLLVHTPSLEALFSTVLAIQDQRRAKEDKAGARVAADLVLALLPALHAASVILPVRRERAAVDRPILGLPTRLPTIAEIIMAAADHRPANCHPPRSRWAWPEGRNALPEQPEVGRDADGQRYRDDWRQALISTFGENNGRFAGKFRQYLKERFIQRDLRSVDWENAERELIDTIAYQLKALAEDKRRPVTFYFIVQLPKDPQVRAQREQDIAALKRDFPHIAFLRLVGEEPLNEEVRRYDKLRAILYEEPELDA